MKKTYKLTTMVPFVIFLIFSISYQVFSADYIPCLLGKRAALIIPETDFRDEELIKPKQIFDNHGIKADIFSTSLKEAVGMLGFSVYPDFLINNLSVKKYDIILFVGGVGASQYWFDSDAHRIVRETIDTGRILGAISIAPVTIANAGVLSGKKAAVWRSEAKKLINSGAIYTKTDVQVDGNIITANGPDAAEEFALAIIDVLSQK